MQKHASQFNRRGFTLLEPLLAGALLAVITLTIITGVIAGQQSAAAAADRTKALFLAQEGLEALRNMRDHSIEDLDAGEWGLGTAGGVWILSASPDVTDGRFTRNITIAATDTERDITIEVAWDTPYAQESVLLESRLSVWR